MFTDIESSTRLWDEHPEGMQITLRRHDEILHDAVETNGGHVVKTTGDGIHAVFARALDAVAAAAAAQRALEGEDWGEPGRLRVRMGLHTGEAEERAGDYFGSPLNRAARLMAAAHGGQVVLSLATVELVRDGLGTDISLRDLGEHRLRDLARSERVFELAIADLPQDFPPLRTLTALPNNLPAPTGRLIGRELEILEVAEALNEHRCVTVVGPGGCGKTRLALEVAAAMVAEFAEGVWLVQLAAATTPDQIEELTARALHVGERGSEPVTVSLRRTLAERDLLLVIDNCEHLVGAVAEFVDELLSSCPRVRVLGTSRELLGVPGEKAFWIAPLRIGDAEHIGDAGQLFVDRASAGVPGFDAATADHALIADVCRRLDGLPLAIELAAARLRSLSLQQISDRLDDRFQLLTGGARTAGERQRTLEAVVAWSYDLLDEPERRTFRRVAEFADSFALDAAETVAGWGNVGRAIVSDVLGRLVDKSLIVPLRNSNEYRYQMLETLREYGRGQLVLAGENDQARRALFAWAREYTDRLESDMRTPRQDASLAAATRERGNLRAIYEQARDHSDLELALRIVTFAPIMLHRDRRAAIDELLAQLLDVPMSLRGHALTSQAQFAFGMGLSQDGIAAGRAAAELFEAIGDRRHAAWARYFETFNAWGHDSDDHLRVLTTSLLEEFRQLDEPLGLAYLLWVSSQLELDADRADALAGEAEALFREIGAPFGLAHALEGRALIALRRNDTGLAARYLTEALGLLSKPDEPACTAHVIEAIATLLSYRED
ncbi:MAG TPA: AAA family ATPase, partial [Acidimicrobiales bacterium]